MKSKESTKASMFEEMLMWTSYRYAIGRKSYVTSLAYEIPQHYYYKLTSERRQFTANDIRREIYDTLSFSSYSLKIHRLYPEDEFNPLDTIFKFIQRENIQSWEEFLKYRDIEYDVHTDTFKYSKVDSPIDHYYSKYDLTELICWETFASCFDEKNYKTYNNKTFFKTWREKLEPAKEPGYLKLAPFGYEEIWLDLEDFLERGEYCHYLLPSDFKEK